MAWGMVRRENLLVSEGELTRPCCPLSLGTSLGDQSWEFGEERVEVKLKEITF